MKQLGIELWHLKRWLLGVTGNQDWEALTPEHFITIPMKPRISRKSEKVLG